MRFLILSVFSLLLFTNLSAQKHICGTTIHDQQLMEEKFIHSHQDLFTQRGDKIYIPVKFHLVGKADGKGKVGYKAVLNQLDVLNRDYAEHNFVFYLKDGYNFGSINNNTLYENPRDNEEQLEIKKDDKAVNIFIVNTIGSSILNSTVLGYYSPSNDLIVAIKSELESSSNTLSHEVGHFFNLRHTFYGWEEEPYKETDHGNPCVLSLAPGSNVQVEKMDKSNCNVAGDNVCDTPPDYHFDINYSNNNCLFTKIVRDKNGDTIKTMVNNQMSYFSNCDTFKFTLGQETRMRTNHGNFNRAYIRSSYVPNIDTLPVYCNFVFPQDKDTAYNYASVDITWEDVNADFYLLEIQNGSEYYTYFTSETIYNVTELKPKKQYFASVRAFNDGFTGTATLPTRFFTGDLQSSTVDFDNNESILVYPNPSNGDKIYIQLKSLDKLNKISFIDVKGVVTKINFTKETETLFSINRADINTKTNVGFLLLNTDKSVLSQKIILE